jgi:soluble lytic murein transglycosylase-like protein
LSIFNRINAIENKISSLEGRFEDRPMPSARGVGKKNFPTNAQGVTFDNLVNSLADDKFKPGQSSSSSPPSAAQQLNSASVKPYVQEAAAKYNVDPALIEAVIKQESAYNASAQSHVGAQGLMQLMPGTAKDLGVQNSLDPKENVMGGTKYLAQLMDMFDGNLTKVLAGYNAGPGNVQKYGGVPPFEETQNYVEKVLNNYSEFKS